MTDLTDRPQEGPFAPGPYLVMAAGENLSDALRRMALEQLDVVIAGFDFEANDALLDHKVHLARKAGSD